VRPQPLKTTLIMSALFTALVTGFVTLTGNEGQTAATIALNALLVFGIIFFTMRMTNRLTVAAVNRFSKKQPQLGDAPAPEPTTTRPDHVQRRRSRRRPRGRRHRA
jgi:hypothetical protein